MKFTYPPNQNFRSFETFISEILFFFLFFFSVFVLTYSCFMIGGLLAWSKSSCVWFLYYFHHYYVRELLLQLEFWLTGQLILKSHILLNYLRVCIFWLFCSWLQFKIKPINISRNGDEFTILVTNYRCMWFSTRLDVKNLPLVVRNTGTKGHTDVQ